MEGKDILQITKSIGPYARAKNYGALFVSKLKFWKAFTKWAIFSKINIDRPYSM